MADLFVCAVVKHMSTFFVLTTRMVQVGGRPCAALISIVC